jgi:putative membrane protein
MTTSGFVPYCGLAPIPGRETWNTDPILISALVGLALVYILGCRGKDAPSNRQQVCFAAGFFVTSAALITPLCNLSVALFSIRVSQHIVLTLIAAPLLAFGRPERALAVLLPRLKESKLWDGRLALVVGGSAYAAAMWTWHMPGPYDETLRNNYVYWAMHITTIGAALLLWHGLLLHNATYSGTALIVGFGTGMQMSLLGAILSLAPRPMFVVHFTTTWPWGLSPLQDQQLGGAIMWVPAGILFTAYSLAAFADWLQTVDDMPASMEAGRGTAKL